MRSPIRLDNYPTCEIISDCHHCTFIPPFVIFPLILEFHILSPKILSLINPSSFECIGHVSPLKIFSFVASNLLSNFLFTGVTFLRGQLGYKERWPWRRKYKKESLWLDRSLWTLIYSWRNLVLLKHSPIQVAWIFVGANKEFVVFLECMSSQFQENIMDEKRWIMK